MRAYYWLYYRLYRLARKTDKSDPIWTAVLMLSMLELTNVLSAYQWIYGQYVVLNNLKLLFVAIAVTIVLANVLIFVPGDRCLRIVARFENETRRQLIGGAIFLVLYILATLSILVFMPVKS